ncbi:hypothetical protein AB0L40_19920 [Patulibacter sp. NPDC049589]|uniref:hypothetical protein n=1 Tax=Patulibacter sp. NPDC049589 TaxID=3154731 RepID=UPI003429AD01
MLPHAPAPSARARNRARRALLTAGAVALAAASVAAPAVAADDPPDLVPYYATPFIRGLNLIPGYDTNWTPQGLAYWPEHDALVISYYDSSKTPQNSRLAIIDRSTGARLKIVSLPFTGHVGGLAAKGKYLWVANEGAVTRVRKTDIDATPDLGQVRTAGAKKVQASSYMTIVGNKMWVGAYDKDQGSKAYRYSLGSRSVPKFDGHTMNTPAQVQGMAIKGKKVLWSLSTGRDERSTLAIRSTKAPTGGGRNIVAPNMSEGVVIAKGEVHVLYESGSGTYSDASYRVKTVHHAPTAAVFGP